MAGVGAGAPSAGVAVHSRRVTCVEAVAHAALHAVEQRRLHTRARLPDALIETAARQFSRTRSEDLAASARRDEGVCMWRSRVTAALWLRV